MPPALVIGNGESRNDIDLNKAVADHTTIGCNALHRDYAVDHLVCCDRRMIEEAVISNNTQQTSIWVREEWYRYFRKTRKDKRIQILPGLPYTGQNKQDKPLHWGSGPYAVLLASQLNDSIAMLGFDLYSLNGRVNNVYKGTSNYANADGHPVDYVFWVCQIAKVFKHSPNKSFEIYNRKDWQMPKQWQYPNVSFKNIALFD